jgi:hypothetical protein
MRTRYVHIVAFHVSVKNSVCGVSIATASAAAVVGESNATHERGGGMNDRTRQYTVAL